MQVCILAYLCSLERPIPNIGAADATSAWSLFLPPTHAISCPGASCPPPTHFTAGSTFPDHLCRHLLRVVPPFSPSSLKILPLLSAGALCIPLWPTCLSIGGCCSQSLTPLPSGRQLAGWSRSGACGPWGQAARVLLTAVRRAVTCTKGCQWM